MTKQKRYFRSRLGTEDLTKVVQEIELDKLGIEIDTQRIDRVFLTVPIIEPSIFVEPIWKETKVMVEPYKTKGYVIGSGDIQNFYDAPFKMFRSYGKSFRFTREVRIEEEIRDKEGILVGLAIYRYYQRRDPSGEPEQTSSGYSIVLATPLMRWAYWILDSIQDSQRSLFKDFVRSLHDVQQKNGEWW